MPHSPGPWKLKDPFKNADHNRGVIFDANGRAIIQILGVSKGGRNTPSRKNYAFDRDLVRKLPEYLQTLDTLTLLLDRMHEDQSDFFDKDLRKIRREQLRQAKRLLRPYWRIMK